MLFLFIALGILLADQISKVWIRNNLPVGQSLFKWSFFQITHVYNTGAAFGIFRDQSFLLTIIALFGIAAILVYGLVAYRRFPGLESRLGKASLGMVLGGTAGNLIDRVRFGYVTDFIDFTYWPAFNIADAAITIGIILFAYSLLRSTKAQKR